MLLDSLDRRSLVVDAITSTTARPSPGLATGLVGEETDDRGDADEGKEADWMGERVKKEDMVVIGLCGNVSD